MKYRLLLAFVAVFAGLVLGFAGQPARAEAAELSAVERATVAASLTVTKATLDAMQLQIDRDPASIDRAAALVTLDGIRTHLLHLRSIVDSPVAVAPQAPAPQAPEVAVNEPATPAAPAVPQQPAESRTASVSSNLATRWAFWAVLAAVAILAIGLALLPRRKKPADLPEESPAPVAHATTPPQPESQESPTTVQSA